MRRFLLLLPFLAACAGDPVAPCDDGAPPEITTERLDGFRIVVGGTPGLPFDGTVRTEEAEFAIGGSAPTTIDVSTAREIEVAVRKLTQEGELVAIIQVVERRLARNACGEVIVSDVPVERAAGRTTEPQGAVALSATWQ